jgi:uncharacterized membrane protein YgdD (TMEM256/DUF423 family)
MRQLVRTRDGLLVGLAGASAVMLGAFGAHALRNVLDAAHHELWHTALALAVACGSGKASRVAIWAFALGVLLFSGSLYGLALGAPRWLGIVTPLGGVAFMVGWLALGLSLRSARR